MAEVQGALVMGSWRRRRPHGRPLGSGYAVTRPALQREGSREEKSYSGKAVTPLILVLVWVLSIFSPALLRYPGSSSTRVLVADGERGQRVKVSGEDEVTDLVGGEERREGQMGGDEVEEASPGGRAMGWCPRSLDTRKRPMSDGTDAIPELASWRGCIQSWQRS